MRNFINLQRGPEDENSGGFTGGIKGSSSTGGIGSFYTPTNANTNSSSGGGTPSWLESLFGNLGGIAVGASTVITALGNNRNNKILATNQTQYGQYGLPFYGNGTTGNGANTIMWVVIVLVILVVLFFVVRAMGVAK